MKFGTTLAVSMALAASAFLGDATQRAYADDDDFSGKATVAATQSGGKVHINITPNGTKDNPLFINTDYPLTIKLSAKGSGTVGKDHLTKDDGNYVKSDHDGKALSVSFDVDAPSGLTGEAKLVVCSLSGCGKPTKFPFESK